MKRFVPRLLVVYGVSLSVMFGVALIPDYAALIQAVEQRQEQAEAGTASTCLPKAPGSCWPT